MTKFLFAIIKNLHKIRNRVCNIVFFIFLPMKWLFSRLLVAWVALGFFGYHTVEISHAWTVVEFEVIAPTTAKVNEAIDVTIRAIDAEKKVVEDYKGSIIFVSKNFGDVIPSQGKSITFSAEDKWQKVFSKGVIFKTPGKQEILVMDVSDSPEWKATITITPADATSGSGQESVTIITPENNSKISGDTVIVSGKTKKNSKVSIILNGQEAGTAVTDSDGLFNKNITGITQDKNILSVAVLDGNNATIGKSTDINFEKIGSTSSIQNVLISPESNIIAGDQITFTVEATPGLSNVSITLEKSTLEAKASGEGKYTLTTVAPSASGSYSIDVTATDSLGKSITKEKVLSFTVAEKKVEVPAATFKNIKAGTKDKRVTLNFFLENANPEIEKFKIVYGENATSLTKEVLTYASGKILQKDGSYTWYIDNLEPKAYTFKILGIKWDGTLIAGLESDAINTTIGATTCTVANVGDIHIVSDASKSMLSWTSVTGALSYNVYKLWANGEYNLVQNIKENTYTLYLASGAVTHDDFAVKALCDQNTESADYTKAVKVQTGPGMTAILVILSGIIAAIALRRYSVVR